MWGGIGNPPPAGAQGGFGNHIPQQQQQQHHMAASATPAAGPQKHDIFVGNLAFNTTEEQLHQAFSEIGKVINVRLVSDVDSGKPRGYVIYIESHE